MFDKGKYKDCQAYQQHKNDLTDKLKETFEGIKEKGLSSIPPPKKRIPAAYRLQKEYLEENGVRIRDEQTCLRTLHNITYYRLKGYLLPFYDEKTGRYEGADFEMIRHIHDFDSQMRAILLYALSEIEVHLRAQFSYFHSRKYGAYGYLDADNYSPKHNHAAFLHSLERSVSENADIPFVLHYLETHGGIMPFWAMSELMGFGQWFYFYKGMERADQTAFLKQLCGVNGDITEIKRDPVRREAQKDALLKYGIAEWRFSGWLGCCKTLRNICAHCGRLYDMNAPFIWNPRIPWIPNTAKTRARAAELNNQYFHQTLFGSMIAVMFLYPDTVGWNQRVFPKIKDLLEYYADKGIDGKRIGFPPDWETWLQKP